MDGKTNRNSRHVVISNMSARHGAAAVDDRELTVPARQILTPERKPQHAPYDPITPRTERKLKITVLSGGPSNEREVSLKSGRAVAGALKKVGHDVHVADIDVDNLEALDIPADLVFIALHGEFGEDGQVQRILEQRGLRYCGSDAQASALAMDKARTKARFVQAGIPTPRYEVVTPDTLQPVLHRWSPPAVIKPVDAGSSVDCVMADDPSAFCERLTELTDRYGQCLVEDYVEGLELTVGILGDQPLPPIQIRTKRRFYDYQAKYEDNDTQYLFDIDLPDALLQGVQTLSLRAHQALGCRDFSRVDWMIDARTQEPYALEVNTIPGFTDHSLLPKAAARVGLAFPELCQRIVELTCRR